MTETIPSPVSRATAIWRPLAIAVVAVLAVGIGVVAGAFLIAARPVGTGPAAAYVPAAAPVYFEWRVVPSADQDAALRGILERFPIPSFEADRPLVDQLTEMLDEELAAAGQDVSYADDVAPWWDGRLTTAITEYPSVADQASAEMPGFLVLLGVTDAAAAEESIDRLRAEAGEFRATEHDGVTIWVLDDEFVDDPVAYAITDDQVILASSAADLVAALDRHAGGGDSIAESDAARRLAGSLPQDWLMLGIVNGAAMAEQMRSDLETAAPEMGAMYDALLEGAVDGVMTVSATADRVLFDAVSDQPQGELAVSNEDRGLADQVPADALLYADGGGIGPAYARFVSAMKEAFATDPFAADGIGQAEAALGADLEELLAWIDDGALVAGWDGTEPYAGMILVPSDGDAARQRVNGLLALARLATLDPSLGVSVSDETVAGTEVTTLRWEGDGALPELGIPSPGGEPIGVAVQIALGEDRVIIGVGDRFATRVLELDPADSLAASDRFAGSVDELGGTSNVGVTWFDLTGTREAAESALADAGVLDAFVEYEDDIQPWLLPLDRWVGVTRVEADRVVYHGVLIFD